MWSSLGGQSKLQQISVKMKLSGLIELSLLDKLPGGNYVQVNNYNPEFEIQKTFYFGPNLIF